MIKVTKAGLLFDMDKVFEADKELKTESGIYIPEIAKDKGGVAPSSVYEVLDVGPDCKHVKKGDKVIMNYNASGIPIVISKDEKYLVYQEFEVIAIV
jgi:co-chaperonin GroES (HSP10)